jgi:hypothetical protein
MTHDQVVTPGQEAPGQQDGRRFWRRVGAAIGALAAVVGLIAGGLAIVEFVQRASGPATFTDPLHTSAGMRAFLRFADEHDGEVVRLDTRCLYQEGPRTCVDQSYPIDPDVVLLDLNDGGTCEPDRQGPCDGSVVLYFFTKDVSEAQIDNGEYGAGSIVVRGYFTLSKRGNLGTLPPGAMAIYLTAVPPQDVPG